MTLRDLILHMDVLDIDGATDRVVQSLEHDVRRVRPGSLFFALQRGEQDGHAQIEQAIQRGAVGVVCRRNGSIRQAATKIETGNPRLALGQAAAAFYGRPAEKLKVLGVASECGGWNIAFLLKQILEHCGRTAGVISTMGHQVGQRRLPSGSHFPEPSEIQALLKGVETQGLGTCLIEFPVEELTRERLEGLAFDGFVFASGKKLEMIPWLQRSSKGKTPCSLINLDERDARGTRSPVQPEIELTYGLSGQAEVQAMNASLRDEGTEFDLAVGGRRWRCHSRLLGRHNLYYLLGATAAALTLDISAEDCAEAISQMQSPPGNLERVGQSNVFVDEARTAESVERVLAAAKEVCRGRLLALMGCGERVPGRTRFQIGQTLGRYCDSLILTADNPGRESVEQICSVIAQGIDTQGHSNYTFEPDRAAAIEKILRGARPDDLVLILGKGERTHQELAATIVPFDDRIIARETLDRMGRMHHADRGAQRGNIRAISRLPSAAREAEAVVI